MQGKPAEPTLAVTLFYANNSVASTKVFKSGPLLPGKHRETKMPKLDVGALMKDLELRRG